MHSELRPRASLPSDVPGAGWLYPHDLCTPFDWQAIFRNAHPVELDLGAGDGGFIIAHAAANPGRNFVAVERLLGRARKIAKAILKNQSANLRVLRIESGYLLRYLVPPQSISIIHLMFPDPWPKARHAHRRLVQPEFVQQLARVLVPGGEFRLTTDHAEYFEAARACIDSMPEKLLNSLPMWKLQNYPQTDFEREFAAQGRSTFRARWGKDGPPVNKS